MRKPVLPYANNKGADQPTHSHSLISAFVVRCLDSIILLVSTSEISSLYLASVDAQAGLSFTWLQTLKTGFVATRFILFSTLKLLCVQLKTVLHVPTYRDTQRRIDAFY